MKRIISLSIVFILACGMLAVPASAAASFPDVPATHWSYTYVSALGDLIAGYQDGTFGPSRSITRAELVTIVVKSSFGPQPEGSGHWAGNYMIKAVDSGLLFQDEFSRDTWDMPILRQDIALVVARAMEVLRNEEPVEDTDSFTSKITDWDTTCTACKPYIAQVFAKGIVGGYPDGSFGGGRTATRAEAATMLVRLVNPAYRAVTIGGVAFTRQTDVLPDGRMTIAKSMEYMDITLKNLQFYKENGKFYVKGNLPELPEGFENHISINLYITDANWIYETHGLREDTTIPVTGEFVREIRGMTNTSQINSILIKTFIVTTDNDYRVQYSVTYTIQYNDNDVVSVYEQLNHGKGYHFEYDFSNLFTW